MVATAPSMEAAMKKNTNSGDKMQAFSRNLSDVDTWQSTLLLDGQHPIEAFGINIAGFYKIGRPNL